MNILLRKYHGKLVPFFGRTSAPSFGASAPIGSVQRALFSPMVFALIAIAMFVAAAIAGLLHPPTLIASHDMSHLAMASMLGTLTAKSLREKRATLGEEANKILLAAGAEKRELTAEDTAKFDKIHEEITKLGADIERVERQERLNKELGESRGLLAGNQNRRPDDQGGDDTEEQRAKKTNEAFNAFLRYGMEGLEPEERALMQGRFRVDRDRPMNAREERAAQTVSTTGGGYLIPQGFSGELEKNMKMFGGVEQACDVFTTETGNVLPWPTVDDTANTGRLLTINSAITNTAVVYGQVNFGAYKFSSDSVLVPVELMQDSAFDLNAHLALVLGERLGRVHNTYQTTGTGSSQPSGIVVGASNGVTAVGTTAVTIDELLNLVHSIDPAYRNPAFGAGWMFNDSTFKILRQMKDGEGRPLWQAGLVGGAPDTLYGYPFTVNQDMAAMTTGQKPILFGALKKFKVRKVKEVTVLRLVERYADNHQIGFLAFTRMDSQMLDSGAQDPVKYITMA